MIQPLNTLEFFGKLAIPTHPEFDLDTDSGSTDYVPPVQLNNLIILYTNAAIELTERVVVLNREIERLRLERKHWERKQKVEWNRLLAAHPAPSSASKNLLLTEAYVYTLATQNGTLGALQELDRQIAARTDDIEGHEAEVDNLKYTMMTLKLACENIQTHLSFVKQEAKLHRA